jgi:glycosyltransferase involved in cell wall biosynthesis
MKTLSIITPAFNTEKYIGLAIRSVLSQTFTDWEMLIVDDCSDDNTANVVESFAALDPRIRLIQMSENAGPAVARNTAIEMSSGRYIAFLDSDDTWAPDKLERQIAFMKKNDYPFTFTAYEKINHSGFPVGRVSIPEKVTYQDLLKVCSIGCLTVIFDTNYFGKQYMPLIRKRQDYGLWLKLLKQTDYAYGLNQVLAQYRVHNESISSNKFSAAAHQWMLYRNHQQLGFFRTLYYFSHYASNGLLRRTLQRYIR